MTIVEIFNKLASESSRNAKEDILKKSDSPLLRQVLLYACDPFRRFNITGKADNIVGTGHHTIESSENEIFELLDSFALGDLTGKRAVFALETLAMSMMTEDFEIVRRILKKDLRCGVSDSTVNKVFKNLVPTFDVQLAASPDRLDKMTYPALIEPKLDGMRCLVIYDGVDVCFVSRSGKPITTLDYMKDEIIKLANSSPWVFDGEVMSSTFSNTMSDVKRKTAKNENAILYIFDAIPFFDFSQSRCKITQSERKAFLASLWDYKQFQFLKCTVASIVKSEEEAVQKYKEFRSQGHEGAIVKNMSSPYLFKRNDGWVKMKPLETFDLPIIGYEEGTGKHAGRLGAFILDYNGIDCRVGTGFSDKEREDFWAIRNEMIDQIAEIEAMEETQRKDGGKPRLRHTRFVRIRSIAGSKA